MQFHTIEVDSEVFDFLKEHAEPFEDSPNSVLRKLLFNIVSRQPNQGAAGDSLRNGLGAVVPSLPSRIPKALEHTLQMIYLVKKSHRDRKEATHLVADKHGVDYQTIIDKYCRQLGLKAYEMDRLLGAREIAELKSLLVKKYEPYEDVIQRFFQDLE